MAFAVGLQAWYGLALLGLVAQLFRGRRQRRGSIAGPAGPSGAPGLFGSWVFLPLSSGAGAAAGVVAGLASPTQPAWFVALAYWLVGSLHGLVAWRLARRGYMQLPETV
ncbi:MAG TPA: hypothetical protein VMN37_08615 [Gemmatimonadales bacterium]|nr:hypothetical protein [Gemmatimonadales bacterium]